MGGLSRLSSGTLTPLVSVMCSFVCSSKRVISVAAASPFPALATVTACWVRDLVNYSVSFEAKCVFSVRVLGIGVRHGSTFGDPMILLKLVSSVGAGVLRR